MSAPSETTITDRLFIKPVEVTGQLGLLPELSRSRYEEEYDKFCVWCEQENIKPNQVSDDVMLEYISAKSKDMKPNTVWSRFSMLKSCFKIKLNIDVSNYSKTLGFLRKQSIGYKPRKASVFTSGDIVRFMTTAPDNEWLLSKVILTFGIFGACRRDDMIRLNIDDVRDNGDFLTVFLRDGKSRTGRSFNITNEGCSFEPCSIIRKYLSLRPSHMQGKRLFVGYRGGRCVAQHVGCHTISGVPRKVAKYLNLENPDTYTGHALRRSSAYAMPSQDQKSAAGSSKRPVGGDGGKKQKKRKTTKNEESQRDIPGNYVQANPFEIIEIEEQNIKQEIFEAEEFDEMNSSVVLPDDGPNEENAHFETVYCTPGIIKDEHQNDFEHQDDFETPSSNNATESDTLVPEFEHRRIKIEPREEEMEEEEEDEEEEVVTESLHTRLMWRCPLVSCPEMFSSETDMYQHLNLNHAVKGNPLSSKSKKVSALRSALLNMPPVISLPPSPSAADLGCSGLVFTTTSTPRVSPITVTSTAVPLCQSVPSSSSGPVTVTTTFSYSSLTTTSAPCVTAVSSSSISSSGTLISSTSSPAPVISSSVHSSSFSPTSHPPASSPTLVSTRTSSDSPPLTTDATTIIDSATSHLPNSLPVITDSQGPKKIIVAPISDQDSDSTDPRKCLLLSTQKPQQNAEAKTSMPTLQIFEPSEPITEDLSPCATDESEIFSISLARFPEDRRVPIKRKLINVVGCIRQKNIAPEKLLIAYYEDCSDSRTM